MPAILTTTCLCGAIAQTLTARSPNGEDTQKPIPIALCHCNTCRRSSGVLCTSYCPIEAPPAQERLVHGETALLTAYVSPLGTKRYFCRRCGCHVFRSRKGTTEDLVWEVATGVIVEERWDDSGSDTPVLEYVRHDHVADTGDGGLAVWLPTVGGKPVDGPAAAAPPPTDHEQGDDPQARTVSAACHCGAIQFDVRPPDYDPVASRQPHSGFSDLLVPFATTDPAITANPDDVKWWLRPSEHDDSRATRWLAGTCACRSCRLATGFEIQTWAFVPRTSIVLQPSGQTLTFKKRDGSNNTGSTPSALSAYQSSPGVERNFCRRCGATVFWHDIWRPDLIDISVGLFQPGSNGDPNHGFRVESLLDWCTTRVSFVEEAPRGRHGQSALRGTSLMDCLEAGMESS